MGTSISKTSKSWHDLPAVQGGMSVLTTGHTNMCGSCIVNGSSQMKAHHVICISNSDPKDRDGTNFSQHCT